MRAYAVFAETKEPEDYGTCVVFLGAYTSEELVEAVVDDAKKSHPWWGLWMEEIELNNTTTEHYVSCYIE